jgi:hypothetical protein
MGYAAVELISSGQTSLMTAMQGREIIGLPLADIVGSIGLFRKNICIFRIFYLDDILGLENN